MAAPSIEFDWDIRQAAFAAVAARVRQYGPVLSWNVIAAPFNCAGTDLLLANRARGIFRPKEMRGGVLSIKTTVPRSGRRARYEDKNLESDGAFVYRFQGEDLSGFDNELLRVAWQVQMPLIYFYGLSPSLYRPIWPVFVTEFDGAGLQCSVSVSPTSDLHMPGTVAADRAGVAIERRYATVETKRRLHQDAFRLHVLDAYDDRCAVCQLPRRELLDAAHIVPDADVQGVAEIPNGLALCKLHHGAFDANLLGIRPDGSIDIAQALLDEHDGPTLEFALKGFRDKSIHPPRLKAQQPKREYLEARYEAFLKAG